MSNEKNKTATESPTPVKFGQKWIGCVINNSSFSADDCNSETIEFAKQFGFECEDIPEGKDASEILSEEGDNAVSFLNDQENLPFCYWQFEDNSLFYGPTMDNVSEDVGFTSSKENEYPGDDYEGEWLHVSDHGNATLYHRENGNDTEIWAIV